MALAYFGWAAETDNMEERFERYGQALALHDIAIAEMEVKSTLYSLHLVTARLLRGDAYYDLGQLHGEDGPFQDEAVAMERYKAALVDYQWVVDKADDEPVGYIGRGWARVRLRTSAGDKGHDCLERAMAGHDPAAATAAERECLELAIADFEKAVALTEDEREEDQAVKFIPAYRGLGWANYYLARTYHPPDPQDPDRCKVGAVDLPGSQCFRAYTDSAIEAFGLLIGHQDDAAIHYRVRAQLHWLLNSLGGQDKRRRLELSVEDYDQALRLAPDQAEWYYRRGHLHYALARIYRDKERSKSRSQALRDLKEAAALAATRVAYWKKFADVAHAYGDYEQATLGYEEAAELEPEKVGRWLRMAREADRADDHAKAAKAYEKVAALEPTNGDHFRNLGWRLYLNREYERSIEASQQAILLLPEAPVPYFNLGLTYAAMGDQRAALESYLGGIAVAEGRVRQDPAGIALAEGQASQDSGGEPAAEAKGRQSLVGMAVAEATHRRAQYGIGLYDVVHARDISEESRAFLLDLLERARAGGLRDFVCKVVYDQAGGLGIYREPEATRDPPMDVLIPDARLTPLARNPTGRWIHVEVDQTGERGWVRADAAFVACNIDITGLPVE
jgi:tetratricopeptide (TPR) repeat protein